MERGDGNNHAFSAGGQISILDQLIQFDHTRLFVNMMIWHRDQDEALASFAFGNSNSTPMTSSASVIFGNA